MGRSHTSLSREIKRNKSENGYRYKQAQRKALARHKTKPKAIKLTEGNYSPHSVTVNKKIEKMK
jgi:IS30 family transposase